MSVGERIALGVTDADGPVDGLEGPFGGQVQVVRRAGLALLLAPGPERLDTDAALALNRVLTTLAGRIDVVPLRLGPPAPRGVLVESFVERREALWAALARIRGAVELGSLWRVEASAKPAPAQDRGGAAWLRARAAASVAERAACDRIDAALDGITHEALRGIARDAARRVSGGILVSRPLLVARAEVEEARQRILERAAAAGHAPVLTGPWAPWSFVGPSDTAANVRARDPVLVSPSKISSIVNETSQRDDPTGEGAGLGGPRRG